CHSRHRHELLQLANAEVGDADRARVAEFTSPLHPRPRSSCTTLGPMDEVQVDVVDTESPEAALSLRSRVLASRVELRCKEHLRPRHSAVPQPPPHALLVAVDLSGVNVPVPNLQRPAYGADARGPVGYLPDAESEPRDVLAVSKHPHAPICSIRNQ